MVHRFVAEAAAATTTAAPFVHTAHAAGKLSVGFWDHWVPGANDTSRALVEEWAENEKVDVQIDYITSMGEKLRLTIAAESQARSGHDILQMASWWPHAHASHLQPVDELVAELVKLNGAIDEPVTYLGRAQKGWVAVPARRVNTFLFLFMFMAYRPPPACPGLPRDDSVAVSR